MIYHDPTTVTAPRSHVRRVDVLYDGGVEGFSLAMIDWEGVPHIAMRWNVAAKEREDGEKQAGNVMCVGSPSLSGVPSWFILPRELFHPHLFDKESEVFLKLVASWPH